jgi:hypothetical protein
MANKLKQLILIAAFAFMALSVSEYFSDYRQGIAVKRGLTFRATVLPEESNSFVGRMSCDGCNPQQGDTSCTETLPVLCIVHAQTLHRPYYDYYPDFTPYANPDQSFYEGWTGGVLAVTDPVMGLQINSFIVGDNLCKTAYGPKATFATFKSGWYMPRMNGINLLIEKAWDWTKARTGEFNLWGYFNHNYRGKAWVWTQTTPTGNCATPAAPNIPV